MNADELFLICNYAVIPAWLLLAFLPHHRLTQLVVHAIRVPLLLGPLYIWALFFGPPAVEEFRPWNDACSEAMRRVYHCYQADLEVCCLFAEALLNRTP
jgi:hypothetical protein